MNFREWKATGCSRPSCFCDRMAPRAKSEASVSTIAGRSGLKYFSTGAEVNASMSCFCAFSISGEFCHSFLSSAVEFVSGRTILL